MTLPLGAILKARRFFQSNIINRKNHITFKTENQYRQSLIYTPSVLEITNILKSRPPSIPPYKVLLKGFEVIAQLPVAHPIK